MYLSQGGVESLLVGVGKLGLTGGSQAGKNGREEAVEPLRSADDRLIDTGYGNQASSAVSVTAAWLMPRFGSTNCVQERARRYVAKQQPT